MSDSDRLTDLEVRMAFLERALGELDDVVREVADQLASTRATLADLRDQVNRGSDGQGRTNSLVEERPPHY